LNSAKKLPPKLNQPVHKCTVLFLTLQRPQLTLDGVPKRTFQKSIIAQIRKRTG
jgi:hypothetical protein